MRTTAGISASVATFTTAVIPGAKYSLYLAVKFLKSEASLGRIIDAPLERRGPSSVMIGSVRLKIEFDESCNVADDSPMAPAIASKKE